jgi:hypothetical protein
MISKSRSTPYQRKLEERKNEKNPKKDYWILVNSTTFQRSAMGEPDPLQFSAVLPKYAQIPPYLEEVVQGCSRARSPHLWDNGGAG